MRFPPLAVQVIFWIGCFSAPFAQAESRAFIVTGLAGSSANAGEFTTLSSETKRLLAERGVTQIEESGGKATREAVLANLTEFAGKQQSGDEFWFIYFGHCGFAKGNVPALQVSGPRLTANDLKTALDAIQGRQLVLIGASASGEFLPLLKDARRTVVSATKGGSQSDQPRFPAKWVAAFSENPQAAFPSIAARAAALVTEEYVSTQIAQSEHARLVDPVTGKILEPPFGVDLVASTEGKSSAGGAGSLLTASDIEVKITNKNAEWEKQPATDETRQLIAEAKAEPNPEGHSALLLEQRIGFTVEEDRSTEHLTFQRVYLAREEAVEQWANRFLVQMPPSTTTKLEVARIIQPDGSATVYNPAKLAGAIDPGTGQTCPTVMVYLPGAQAGCVVEVGWRTHSILDPTLPYVSETIPVQAHVPALQTSIELRLPAKPTFRAVLNHSSVQPLETEENGRRVLRWNVQKLAAAEPLPGDPPASQWAVSLGVSSLPSWDEFATWYRRIAKGSDVIDGSVKKIATELTANAPSRMEKVQRCYEFVAAFRYVAIEIGVQGFRPRSPADVLANRYGDCKDKANLLIALLRSQGIDAHFVLLNRGGATDVSFPSWQFNHAIAYLPAAPAEGQPGDLWMDATDGVTPFGFVAPGDFGRAGLVFSAEKAEFKTISDNNGSVSRIEDEWDLQTRDGSGWDGSFTRRAKGLAEDELRRTFRGSSPQQRQLQVHRIVSPLWPGADFAAAAVTDVSSMQEPVAVKAAVTFPSASLPVASFPWMELFAAPERDRPLLLNDGHPCQGAQTLRLRHAAAPATVPADWSAEAGGAKFSVKWQRIDPATIERRASVEIANATIAPGDYVAVRRALRDWSEQQRK